MNMIQDNEIRIMSVLPGNMIDGEMTGNLVVTDGLKRKFVEIKKDKKNRYYFLFDRIRYNVERCVHPDFGYSWKIIY